MTVAEHSNAIHRTRLKKRSSKPMVHNIGVTTPQGFTKFYKEVAKNLTQNEKNYILDTYISAKIIRDRRIKINKYGCHGLKKVVHRWSKRNVGLYTKRGHATPVNSRGANVMIYLAFRCTPLVKNKFWCFCNET